MEDENGSFLCKRVGLEGARQPHRYRVTAGLVPREASVCLLAARIRGGDRGPGIRARARRSQSQPVPASAHRSR